MHFSGSNFKSKTLFCPIRLLIFVFGLLATSGALAYSISWNLVSPTTGVTGASTPITLNYTLDITSPPLGLTAVYEGVSGEVNFGNGSSQPFSFAISDGAGGVSTTSRLFSTQYVIPGTYQIGGSITVIDQILCDDGPCGSYTRTFGLSSPPISIGKSPEYVALHTQRAKEATLSLNTLALFGALSSFGSIGDSVNGVLSSALDTTGTKWGTVLSVGLSTIGAGLIGGPVGLAFGSTYAIMAAYYDVTRAVETKLANDPPDWDYQQIYQYSNATFDLDLGLGADVNAYYQNGFAALSRLIESRQGELTSIERGQGALLAGDTVSAAAQAAAAQAFASDYTELAQSAGTWIGSLPEFLSSNGLDAGIPNVDVAYSVLTETALQLRAPSGSVSESGTLGLLGIAFAGMGLVSRWRFGCKNWYSSIHLRRSTSL